MAPQAYATRAKPPAPQYLTQTEMAARLGISARTLSTWHRTGKLRGWRPPGATHGKLLYDADAILSQPENNGSRRKSPAMTGSK